jgi:hypothetical protein
MLNARTQWSRPNHLNRYTYILLYFGTCAQGMWDLEAAILEHHRLLKEAGCAELPSTSHSASAGVARRERAPSAPPPSKRDGPLIPLWDFEAAFIGALEQ